MSSQTNFDTTNINEEISAKIETINTDERNLSKLGTVLRTIGTGLLSASLITFLLHGLYNLDSIGRYFSLAGFTAVLVGIGIFTVKALSDTKGARAYLALATATVLTHFAQIGSFIWTLGNNVNESIPGMFVYSGLNATTVIAIAALAPALLYPVAQLGFSALFRNRAKILSATFVAGSALLLIPLREASHILPIAVLATIATIFIDQRYIRGDVYANSFDGRVSRLIMLSAPALLVIRSLFYDPTALYFATVLTLASAVMVWVSSWEGVSKSLESLLKTVALYTTSVAWFGFLVDAHLDGAIAFYTFGSILLVGGHFTEKCKGFNIRLGLFLIGITGALSAMANIGLWHSLAALVFGAGLIVYSARFRMREALVIGGTVSAIALGSLSWIAFAQIHSQVWLSLAVLGILASVVASLADRYHRQVIVWYRETYCEERHQKIEGSRAIVESHRIEDCVK